MSEFENYRPIDSEDLKATLGHVLLGPGVASSYQTLAHIVVLRDALDYLEARYSRQIAAERERAAQQQPKPAERKKAAEPARKRGRPRGNGQDRQAPAPPLPFAGEEKPSPEVPAAEL